MRIQITIDAVNDDALCEALETIKQNVKVRGGVDPSMSGTGRNDTYSFSLSCDKPTRKPTISEITKNADASPARVVESIRREVDEIDYVVAVVTWKELGKPVSIFESECQVRDTAWAALALMRFSWSPEQPEPA